MMAIRIVWNGEISGNSSFGIAGIEQCLAFEELGCEVYILPTELKRGSEKIPDRIIDMIMRAQLGWRYENSVFIHQGFPHYFGTCRNQHTRIKTAIGVNDSDTVMGQDIINQSCDLVFGSSNFVTQAYKNAGVTIPCFTLPYGINPNIWKYQERPATRDKFRFLCVGDNTGRKRFIELCRAFRDEFKPEEPVELIIKSWGGDNTSGNLQTYCNHQLKTEHSDLPIKDMVGYYRDADCYVMATSGEAVGMPYLEAMATGLPCIATDKGGQTQWTLPEFSYLISSQPYKSPYLAGNQFMPNWQHLKQLMRHAYNNIQEVREKGRAGSEFMHENYTWINGVEKGLNILKTFL